MRNTLGHKRRAILLAGVVLLLNSFPSGCTEFSHFGQITDRESTQAIHGVIISQQQADGTWKRVGQTDGTGRWNIFKSQISGGGDVRLRKRGYRTQTMLESTFLQEHLVLMQADGESSYDRMP